MTDKKYFVLEHGFSDDLLWRVPKKLCRQMYGIDDNEFVILNLNRNQPRKRWDVCIMAFVYILNELRKKRLEKEQLENIFGEIKKDTKDTKDGNSDSDSDSDSDTNN